MAIDYLHIWKIKLTLTLYHSTTVQQCNGREGADRSLLYT
jgi:hypothetical protein